MPWYTEPESDYNEETEMDVEREAYEVPFATIYSPDGVERKIEIMRTLEEEEPQEEKIEIQESRRRLRLKLSLPKFSIPDLSFLGGTISLGLGVAALSLHWLSTLPPPFNLNFFSMVFVVSLLAIMFGWSTAHDLIRPRKGGDRLDRFGIFGFTLGLVSILLSTAWLLLFSSFIWGFR